MSNTRSKNPLLKIDSIENLPPYQKAKEWVRITSKKEGVTRFSLNKSIANAKKIIRQIENEQAIDNINRAIEIIMVERENQEYAVMNYNEHKMSACENETLDLIDLLEEFAHTLK